VAESCGGCPGLVDGDYLNFTQTKLVRLQELLDRLGIRAEATLISVASPVDYRRRIRLRCLDGRVSFFNAHKDSACSVLTPGLRDYVQYLFDLSAQVPSVFMGLTHLEVRDADLDGMFGMSRFGPEPFPAASFQTICDRALVVSESQPIGPVQRFRLTEALDYFVPLRSFIQINEAVNRQIQHYLKALCSDAHLKCFWDLYCGVGNLSLMLGAAGMSGGGVELNAESIGAAQRSVSRWSDRVAYRIADARLPSGLPSFTPDIVIANPPRAGLKKGIEQLIELRAEHVFLMSCSLESLHKDLAGLITAGYAVVEVRGYDMFPFTDHLETTVFARKC
jgi:hypothetical protein